MDNEFRLAAVNYCANFGDIPDLIGGDFDEVMHLLKAEGSATKSRACFGVRWSGYTSR